VWTADGLVPSRFIAIAKLEPCFTAEQSFEWLRTESENANGWKK